MYKYKINKYPLYLTFYFLYTFAHLKRRFFIFIYNKYKNKLLIIIYAKYETM